MYRGLFYGGLGGIVALYDVLRTWKNSGIVQCLLRSWRKSCTVRCVVAWKRQPAIEAWKNPFDSQCQIQNDTVIGVFGKQRWLPTSSLIQNRKQGCYRFVAWSLDGSIIKTEVIVQVEVGLQGGQRIQEWNPRSFLMYKARHIQQGYWKKLDRVHYSLNRQWNCQQPIAHSQKPIAHSSQRFLSEQTIAHSQERIANSEEPIAKRQQP